MSAIQGVSAAATAPSRVPAPKAQTPTAESAAQEAQESSAVTRSEAAKGDQQAARRLAQSQVASAPQKTGPAPSSGRIDLTA